MTANWKCFVFEESYRPAEDESLQEFLLQNMQNSIRLDATGLRRIDAKLLELLLCASRSWQDRGLEFEVFDMSSACEENLTILGVTQDVLARRISA